MDPTKDRRRLRKRTLDDIATRADALDTLVESLRTSDDAAVQALLQLVRDGAPVADVVQRAKAMLKHDGTRTSHRVRRTILDIATLIDDPPIRDPAKPWTEVTSDDSAVSHLISMYFTWHHWALQFRHSYSYSIHTLGTLSLGYKTLGRSIPSRQRKRIEIRHP